LRQVERRESALHDGHADLVADRPDVELNQGRRARARLGTAEGARPAKRDVALRFDADHVDHVRPAVVAVPDGHPPRAAGRLCLAARQPPAGPGDKLPYLVVSRPDGDPLFDTVFHGCASLAPCGICKRSLAHGSAECNSTLAHELDRYRHLLRLWPTAPRRAGRGATAPVRPWGRVIAGGLSRGGVIARRGYRATG